MAVSFNPGFSPACAECTHRLLCCIRGDRFDYCVACGGGYNKDVIHYAGVEGEITCPRALSIQISGAFWAGRCMLLRRYITQYWCDEMRLAKRYLDPADFVVSLRKARAQTFVAGESTCALFDDNISFFVCRECFWMELESLLQDYKNYEVIMDD